MDGISVAVILMFAGLFVALLVLVADIAFRVRAGNDILAEIRDMLARMLDGSGPTYAVRYPTPMQRAHQPVDESFGKFKPVDVTRDDESTPLSPVDPESLAKLRAEHRTQMEVPVYRGPMPSLGEDEERSGWEKRSGTFTLEGR